MNPPELVSVHSLPEYFREHLREATPRHDLSLSDPTECYLVNLLDRYARTEALFEADADGALKAPLLAALFSRALASGSAAERDRALQRLGDVALFWAGFFAHGFAAKLIDVDYYVAMGHRAYGSLADHAATRPYAPIRPVFAELAAKFVAVVDLLNELADQARPASTADLMRYYEIWQKTGSRRARAKLGEWGVCPVRGPARPRSH